MQQRERVRSEKRKRKSVGRNVDVRSDAVFSLISSRFVTVTDRTSHFRLLYMYMTDGRVVFWVCLCETRVYFPSAWSAATHKSWEIYLQTPEQSLLWCVVGWYLLCAKRVLSSLDSRQSVRRQWRDFKRRGDEPSVNIQHQKPSSPEFVSFLGFGARIPSGWRCVLNVVFLSLGVWVNFSSKIAAHGPLLMPINQFFTRLEILTEISTF